MTAYLRKKFVIVTTSLMIVVFGTFLIANYIYNSYWTKSDTADMLDLIAESGYFLYEDDINVENTIKNIAEGGSPIAGLLLSEDGKVLSKKIIGDNGKMDIPESIIQKILNADDTSYQIDRYLYSVSELKDGRVLLVIMDISVDENIWKKIIGTSSIIIAGVFSLVLITFYLSRFVTEPAEKALAREKRFISDASHELKTPLGAISINAQALKASMPDNLYAKNIASESERMGRLIERLLTLSGFDEGRVSEKTHISLSDLTMEMALSYESVAYDKGLSYDYDVEDDIFINGNADEIRQLFAILIDNAVKNAGEDGFVEIKCEASGEKAVIEVKNSGEGILESDLPHVFERFYTSDNSRSNKSFGLGLSIASAIVKGHNGDISVSSNPGVITVFTVSFKTE